MSPTWKGFHADLFAALLASVLDPLFPTCNKNHCWVLGRDRRWVRSEYGIAEPEKPRQQVFVHIWQSAREKKSNVKQQEYESLDCEIKLPTSNWRWINLLLNYLYKLFQSLLQANQRGEGLGADLLCDRLPPFEGSAGALYPVLVVRNDMKWIDVSAFNRNLLSCFNLRLWVEGLIPLDTKPQRMMVLN